MQHKQKILSWDRPLSPVVGHNRMSRFLTSPEKPLQTFSFMCFQGFACWTAWHWAREVWTDHTAASSKRKGEKNSFPDRKITRISSTALPPWWFGKSMFVSWQDCGFQQNLKVAHWALAHFSSYGHINSASSDRVRVEVDVLLKVRNLWRKSKIFEQWFSHFSSTFI